MQVRLVPAGGVFQQVNYAYRVSGLPAIQPDLGDEFGHRVIQRELAPFTSLRIDSEAKPLDTEPMRNSVSSVVA